MKNFIIKTLIVAFLVILAAAFVYKVFIRKPAEPPQIYENDQFGFVFSLPHSWEGYSIISGEWNGYATDPSGDTASESGPEISIRHPQWTKAVPRQDIPIMIFTVKQWNALQQDKFHIGAAPIGPGELGRNSRYIFALPARYNYAFPMGFEEVEKIINSKPIKTF